MDVSSYHKPDIGNMSPGAGRGKSATEATQEEKTFLAAAASEAMNSAAKKSGGAGAVRLKDLTPADEFRGHLAVAIEKGDTKAVEDLLKAPPEGFNIADPFSEHGGTALHAAVANGAKDIVRLLVDHGGIDMAKLNHDGKSAYQAADDKAKKTNDPKDRETADFLRGRMTDELKRAALDGNYNRAEELVKAGADASILPGGKLGTREQFIKSDVNFSYLLRDAIAKGDTQGALALIKNPPKGWDVNAIGTAFGPAGSDGKSSLLQYLARSTNASNEGTIRALIDQGGVDLAKLDASGKSAFQVLDDYAKATHDPAAQRSADFMRDKMNGELGTAVFTGDQDRAVALLKAGADPKAAINGDPEKSKGFTLLMFAAANKEPKVVKAMLDALPPDERKAFVNQKDDGGGTALHAAAFGGDDATYKMLVEAGGDETVKDDQGQVPKDIPGAVSKRGIEWGAVPIIGFAYMVWRLRNPDPGLNMALITPDNPGAGLPPAAGLSPDTRAFLHNPSAFAAQNFIGDVGAAPGSNFTPRNGDTVAFGVTQTTPGSAPPSHPILGGNAPGAAINVTPAGPGTGGANAATWLGYQNGQDTTITVPEHPTGAEAQFVFTPGVTGCAFYAVNNGNGTITFHHRSYTGQGEQNAGVPDGAAGVGYRDYGPQNGNLSPDGTQFNPNWVPGAMGNQAAQAGTNYANGMAPFAHYDGHQWVIQGQPYQTNMFGTPNTFKPFNQSTGQAGLGGFTIPVPSSPPPH